MADGVKELFGVSLVSALNPFTKAPPSRPSHLTQAQLSNLITLGLSSSHMHLEGDTVIQSIAFEKAERQRLCPINLCSA